MTALADVRTLTRTEVVDRRRAIERRLTQAGLSVGAARDRRYALTAAQLAEIEEYEDLGWLLDPES